MPDFQCKVCYLPLHNCVCDTTQCGFCGHAQYIDVHTLFCGIKDSTVEDYESCSSHVDEIHFVDEVIIEPCAM